MDAVKPSIGRMVHYVSYDSECRAAVVTEIGEVWVPAGEEHPGGAPVSLAVLNPDGMFFGRGVMQSEGDRVGGTWHWPERV